MRVSDTDCEVGNGDRRGFSGLKVVELCNGEQILPFYCDHVTCQMMASLPHFSF